MVSLCSSLWPCVVYGQKSYAHCSLFSDAEWIAHSEQLCHSSQHPSFPPSHPSVTLHGVQRHHVGLCDRPHMAAAQWQCSLSPQLWHHHLQEHGCHARLCDCTRSMGGGSKREYKTITEDNNTDLFILALSRWTNLIALRYLWKTCRTSHVLFWMPKFSRTISASRTCLHRIEQRLIWAEVLPVKIPAPVVCSALGLIVVAIPHEIASSLARVKYWCFSLWIYCSCMFSRKWLNKQISCKTTDQFAFKCFFFQGVQNC